MGSSTSVIETSYEALQANIGKFKCANCLNYLSRGPIKVKVVNSSILCGRCNTVNCVKSDQLSNILQNLQFPCSHDHNGCNEKIKFDDEDHENQCRYKVFNDCPAGITDCMWTGQGSEIYDHFTTHHEQRILRTPSFALNVEKNVMQTYLYKSENYAVLLRCNFKKGTESLHFEVLNFQFDSSTPKNYKIEFSSGEIKCQLETLFKCTPLQAYVPYFSEHNMFPYLTSFSHPTSVNVSISIE